MQKDHRNGHRSLTLRKWGRDDLEQFFEQEHLSKTGVEKPPKSSRPAFSKVLAGGALCRQGYRQARNKAYSKQHTETLPVEAAGGRSKRSQATRSTDGDPLFSAQCTVRCAPETRSDMWAQGTSIPFPPFRACAAWCAWTRWGWSPGPSACEADVMPLHHVPLG